LALPLDDELHDSSLDAQAKIAAIEDSLSTQYERTDLIELRNDL
jgi:hypothetical protein